MSYIAAVLLMHMEEEEAFWALVALLDNEKYLQVARRYIASNWLDIWLARLLEDYWMPTKV